MTTRRRLKGLQAWLQETICDGRRLKAPADNMDITKIERQEPQVYLGWYPRRPDQTGHYQQEAANVCPGILVMPSAGHIKNMEEKRFDRYNGVHRPQDLGQTFTASILFSVYEPGVRLPGYIDDPKDLTLIREGTEEGLFTLTDWMDDCIRKLLGTKFIPNTDLFLNEADTAYSLYTDQNYVVDRRPIFYGFINVVFGCYADEGLNSSVDQFLK